MGTRYLSWLMAWAPVAMTAILGAQEKLPVTLEAVAAQKAATGWKPVWSPDGKRFLHVTGSALRIYDCVTKSGSALIALDALKAKAEPARTSGPFAWTNRRVADAAPQWTPDGRSALMASGGDLFLVDTASGSVRQATRTAQAEEDAQLSPDGQWIGYRAGRELFVIPIGGGKPRQLTTGGSDTVWNGQLDWVYPEELSIPRAWWWSPDSRSIAYLQFDVSREMLHPHVDPGPVAAVLEQQRFPKAGTANATVRLGVVSTAGGKTRWMDTRPEEDTLLARVQWMPGGQEIAVTRLSRIQDRLELLAFSTKTGAGRTLLTESDSAWINLHDILHFFPGGDFLWASERDGHRHLYLVVDGKPRQLTRGEWEVVSLERVDVAKRDAWVTTTRPSALERQLERINLVSGVMERVTKEPGTHVASVSPGGKFWLDFHHSLTRPPVQVLRDGEGESLAVLQSPEAGGAYALQPVEPVSFSGRDGTKFHGQIIKPAGFTAGKRYPAVVMVYGGPHAQTVRDAWAGLNWEQALAARGYVVWRMDNRGSNYRGHAFETPIHKRFGQIELSDQLEGLDYLIAQGFVDPARIGIYGWSYGGYMTLQALAHGNGRFAAGISGAPVTDWRNYDTIYTERYMGLPARNEDGYRASSPVHAAGKMQGALLLLHNFQDDNVLFQQSQQMMDALQRAGKPFEVMFYPQKAHGVTGVYKLHQLETMTRFLDRALKPEPITTK